MVNVDTVVATVVEGATVGHHKGGTKAATAGTSRRAVMLVAPATELHKERVWGALGTLRQLRKEGCSGQAWMAGRTSMTRFLPQKRRFSSSSVFPNLQV